MKTHTLAVIGLLLVGSFCFNALAGPARWGFDEPYKPLRTKLVIPQVARDQVICFAVYTTANDTLKMTATFYPLQEGEPREAWLEVQRDGKWQKVATTEIVERGWTAHFRVNNWDTTRDQKYRVRHAGGATYGGLVRKDPVDKNEIVVVGFTGNSNGDRSLKPDIIANVKAQDPDLLFFSGDQSYDHKSHYKAWILFGRQFGELTRNRPTVTIPDDHDVGQGNLWGEGGKKSTGWGATDGGYVMPADYVKEVERSQTWHLPDPYDPTPIAQGIGVYYTSLNIGGIDFAIIEDRKFKTGPMGLVPQQGPRPDHIRNPDYDPASVDVPEAKLLGDRQLKFLDAWGRDWDGVTMKAALSQTIFCGGAHLHGKLNGRLHADMDSNGWPQSGRARAVKALRKCFGFHLAGDQHLATVIHHGVNDWEDAIVSFCVPSIWNYYGRWWMPEEDPLNHDPASPLQHTGRYYDGFKNKVTMHAYANPAEGNYRAAGYGLVRFNKTTRAITMECWPRFVDVAKPDAQQFPGWPITVNQFDNYGRKPHGYLPTIKVNKPNPIVQVVREATGQVVYTVRAKGDTLNLKVFMRGKYTVNFIDGDEVTALEGLQPTKKPGEKTVTVEL